MLTIESHTEKLKKRVEAGVKLLDEKGPPRWYRKVKLKTLAMNSLCDCILGQLYGGYVEGEKELGFLSKDSMEHGFSLGMWENLMLCAIKPRSVTEWSDETQVVRSPGFKLLTALWKDAIRAKRAA